MVGLQAILDMVNPVAVVGASRKGEPVVADVIDVTADSRTVVGGSLFVAVPGMQADGHRFIGAALAQGAVAVIGEQAWPDVRAVLASDLVPDAPPVPYIQVVSARTALAQACAALQGFPSRHMAVIGVTGTDGKTTTCTLLEAIFHTATQHTATQSSGISAGTVGVITTVGARIGGREIDTGFHVTTPDAPEVQRFLAEMRAAGCTHAVVESTSHGLAQARVAAVDFDVAAVTNITHEHLDYHGTREAYVAAKALLFRALYQTPVKAGIPRCAVLNGDDAGSVGALRAVLAEEAAASGRDIPLRVYGLGGGQVHKDGGLDVYAEAIDYLPDRTRVDVVWWGGAFTISSPLIGEFNVYNMLCAATVGLALGLAPGVVQAGIEAVRGVVGRMERIDEGQPFLAIVDFAHSPVSLERALHTLRPLVGEQANERNDGRGDGKGPGRLIAVFGCAGQRDRAKRRLMGQVSGRLADYTVVTAEDPRTESLQAINHEIVGGLEESGAAGRYRVIEDRAEAIQAAVDMAAPGDVVAAFGKGHEQSMCFGTEEFPWSDQVAMRAALHRRAVKL